MDAFEPKIVAFACNWCSYAGADLAGVSRVQYPPTTRVIRVMCSGRVSPMFILEALRGGADGVLVTGCHLGDCHYISGNEKAAHNVEMAYSLIELLGIEPQRLSASDQAIDFPSDGSHDTDLEAEMILAEEAPRNGGGVEVPGHGAHVMCAGQRAEALVEIGVIEAGVGVP